MKVKITLVDCNNFDNTISLFIEDSEIDFRDSVYAAVEKHGGLSKYQIAKLEAFKNSCEGLYMVRGVYCNSVWAPISVKDYDWNRDEIYDAGDFIHILSITAIQGHRPHAYRVKKSDYSYKAFLNDIEKMRFNGERKGSIVEEIWEGPKIY